MGNADDRRADTAEPVGPGTKPAARDSARVAGEGAAARRVVVLEDDARMRRTLVEALEGHSYRTLAAESGAEVLERLADFGPHVILLDMLLPEMDGFEFLARLRTHPAGADTPVVILSEVAATVIDCIDPEGARVLGVAAILPKTTPLPLVLSRVSRLVPS